MDEKPTWQGISQLRTRDFAAAVPAPFSRQDGMTKPLETAEWQELDCAHYLHPFTDHAGLRQQPARVVTRAEGVYFCI